MTATESPTETLDNDRFHEPVSTDPMWTETCWFSFFVPERSLSGTLYPLFRRNLGITAAAVHVWDTSGRAAHEARYSRNLWHLPFPDSDLTEVALPGGLSYTRLDPEMRFAMRYADGDDIAVDLEFEGVIPPHYLGTTHLDQHGRVRGTLRLDGEEIPVDCYGMRDRTWSVRDDIAGGVGGTTGHGGYSYAMASPTEGFQAIAATSDETCAVRAGYLIRDGELADVVRGERRVLERSEGYPTRVAIGLEDRLGRTLEAEGECRNAYAWQFTPNMLSLICLVDWRWDGQQGWGEDHDNWSNAGWRAFQRSRR